MKILVENHIPYIKGLLEPLGEVKYLAPEDFTRKEVADADVLVVRTRTRCDSALLEGSKVKMIATATIGTDHIDLPWCAAHGIEVANAPGCNAPAVAQYVFASLARLINRPLHQYTIGIVGVGHVGKIVESWARQMNMDVMLNDPPRQQAEGGEGWSSLEEIAERADIITFHTPLDASTHHLVNAEFISRLRRSPIIVNAARGAVVDTKALIDGLDAGSVHKAVIDCWEGEPNISDELMKRAAIATPHIAGYSIEGKTRATQMAVNAIYGYIKREAEKGKMIQSVLSPLYQKGKIEEGKMIQSVLSPLYQINIGRIAASYNPIDDTKKLREAPQDFEALRNHYPLRHEV